MWLFPGGAASITVKSRVAVAGGTLIRFTHHSVSTQTPMTAAVFIPPGVEYSAQVLVALTPRHLFYNTHMILKACPLHLGLSLTLVDMRRCRPSTGSRG